MKLHEIARQARALGIVMGENSGNRERQEKLLEICLLYTSSIAAVAAAVGILDVNYFTKIFKKQLGTTPTQYRREKKAMLGH